METVLVNGGSRGIGAAIVRRLTGMGYSVAFTYCRSKDAAEALAAETGALAICADSENASDILRAVETVGKTLGDVEILINNAAYSSFSLLTDITDEEWEKTFSINLTAPFRYIRRVLPHMIREKRGQILNIVSMWGEVGASCEAHYSASKAGLIGLTQALAKEVGPSGIRVNAVSPGVILTDMNARLSESDMESLKDETPLSRLGTPEDVAAAVAYLLSPEASFITGEVLRVNGGFLI